MPNELPPKKKPRWRVAVRKSQDRDEDRPLDAIPIAIAIWLGLIVTVQFMMQMPAVSPLDRANLLQNIAQASF